MFVSPAALAYSSIAMLQLRNENFDESILAEAVGAN